LSIDLLSFRLNEFTVQGAIENYLTVFCSRALPVVIQTLACVACRIRISWKLLKDELHKPLASRVV